MIKLSVNTLIEKLQSGLSSIKGVEYISLSNPVCFNFYNPQNEAFPIF